MGTRLSRSAKRIVEAEHKEVVGIGGLHILGTERHESRRIDNQLRGRAGRQGDPGSSRFFLSLEDDLMRIFAGDKVKALMQRLGMEKGVAIESKMVSKRIESAQKSVEGRNFESRKHLLEYDDVMNKQRETIYGLRRQLMEEPDQREYLMGDPPQAGVAYDLLSDLTKQYLNPDVSPDDWDVDNYKLQIKTIYDLDADAEKIDIPGADFAGSGGCDLGKAQGQVRQERRADRRGSDAHLRAHHHAQHHRCAVERPPAFARSPEAGHRSGWLWPEGSAG